MLGYFIYLIGRAGVLYILDRMCWNEMDKGNEGNERPPRRAGSQRNQRRKWQSRLLPDRRLPDQQVAAG